MQQLSAVRSVQCSAVCSASGDSAVENRDAWCRWEWNGICDSQRVEMDSAAHVGPLITTRHMDDLTATTCTSLTRPDYLLQYRTYRLQGLTAASGTSYVQRRRGQARYSRRQ